MEISTILHLRRVFNSLKHNDEILVSDHLAKPMQYHQGYKEVEREVTSAQITAV